VTAHPELIRVPLASSRRVQTGRPAWIQLGLGANGDENKIVHGFDQGLTRWEKSKRVQYGEPIYSSFCAGQAHPGETHPTNGSTMRTPAFTKSVRFRVTTAIPWTTAVAAMRLFLIGMAKIPRYYRRTVVLFVLFL
jgi:hypothetical protein